MKQQNEVPLYATLLYEVRAKLDISWPEYVYLDMIHKLSHQRWCTKSLLHCAEDLGITRRHVIRMKNRLSEAGLIEKNLRGHMRVTKKYTEVAVTISHQPKKQVVTISPKLVTNSHSTGGKMSLIENNNRITLDNRGIEKRGKGYKKALDMASQLKLRKIELQGKRN